MPSSAPGGEPQSVVHSQGTLCLWQKIRISARVAAATEPAVPAASRDPVLLGSLAVAEGVLVHEAAQGGGGAQAGLCGMARGC